MAPPAIQYAGATVVRHRDPAFDEDVGNTGRVLARTVEGGSIPLPARRFEQRDVGAVSFLEAPALRDAEAPGWTVGHAVHHALQ